MKAQVLFLVVLFSCFTNLFCRAQATVVQQEDKAVVYNYRPFDDKRMVAQISIPSVNKVAQYERYSPAEETWLPVSKVHGDTVLTYLRNINDFNLGNVNDRRKVLGFRAIHVDGDTNTVWFCHTGEFIKCPPQNNAPYWWDGYPRLVGRDEECEALAQLFNAWAETDIKRIVSQPLPCKYRIGSLSDYDTLSDIAKMFYGDAAKWPLIWNANKTTIKNPDVIQWRMFITIPKLS
jgi:hypothetical protein